MIRKAKTEDWPQCFALGERLIVKTPYRGIEIDREQTMHAYAQCMNSALGFAMVSEKDGVINGVLLGVVEQLWFAKARFASDLVFYSEGWEGLALLRAFIKWAWSIPKVVEVTCAQSSAIKVEQAGVLYRRCGFKKVGGLWTIRKPEE